MRIGYVYFFNVTKVRYVTLGFLAMAIYDNGTGREGQRGGRGGEDRQIADPIHSIYLNSQRMFHPFCC